jgi:hypothetical protein
MGVVDPELQVLPIGGVIHVLSRLPRSGPPPGGGGGGGSFSALDSPSTTVYVPEPIPTGFECTLPTTFIDSRYDPGGVALTWAEDVTLTDTGNVTTNGTNLQNAMNDSLTRAGNTRIKLPNGFVAERNAFQAGKHTAGNFHTDVEWVNKPTEGVRVTAAGMANAPILRMTDNNRGAIETREEAQNWRFVGLTFEPKSSLTATQTIINISPCDADGNFDTVGGGNGRGGYLLAHLPDNITFDRCWVKGRSDGVVVNGVTMNSKTTCIVDCLVNSIWHAEFESHALVSFNGAGPFKIVNNSLETPAITALFGGANPKIQGFVPTDMEIRRNLFTLRDSWNPFHASYDGIAKPIKNRLEFKYGDRVLVEGNILEKAPLGGQNGEAFVIKSMAGESGLVASWYVTRNICIRYNVARDLWHWLYCVGVQMPHLETLGGTDRILFSHNLVYNTSSAEYGNTNNSFQFNFGDATNVQFHHMTVVPKASSVTAFSPRFTIQSTSVVDGSAPGLRLVDSMFYCGQFDNERWFFSNVGPDGVEKLDDITGGDYDLRNTIVIGGVLSDWPGGEVTCPADMAAMKFTGGNPASGLDGDSPAKNAASDGTDVGCDYTKVNLATSGVA